jgi:hypothetical protein
MNTKTATELVHSRGSLIVVDKASTAGLNIGVTTCTIRDIHNSCSFFALNRRHLARSTITADLHIVFTVFGHTTVILDYISISSRSIAEVACVGISVSPYSVLGFQFRSGVSCSVHSAVFWLNAGTKTELIHFISRS